MKEITFKNMLENGTKYCKFFYIVIFNQEYDIIRPSLFIHIWDLKHMITHNNKTYTEYYIQRVLLNLPFAI